MKNAIAKQAEINQELATLIDEDLKQEQELLKSLIKEILEANEKIKNAHFERVQDTEAKLKVLNSEVKRIRRTIKKQDDVVTKKRLELLGETKEEYFETLAEMRLSNPKEHFANPLRKHLADLKRQFSQTLKSANSAIKDFQEPIEAYFETLSESLEHDFSISHLAMDESYAQLGGTTDHLQSALEPLAPFADKIFKTFKEKLEALLSFFDTSELDDLVDEIQSTKANDLDQLTQQKKAIDEALTDELEKIDEVYLNQVDDTRKEALQKANMSLSEGDKKLLDAFRNAAREWIKTADSHPSSQTLKALKSAQMAWSKTGPGKTTKKIDKAFKKEAASVLDAKSQKRSEHLEQTYEIRMQEKEREIQALIDISSLKMRTLLTYLENQEETLLSTFAFMEELLESGYALELALIDLDHTLQVARFQAAKRTQELRLQKTELYRRYERMVQRLEVESLDALERQHMTFKDIQLQMDFALEKERLEINRLYGLHKILDKRVQFIGKSKVKRMDELKELKFQLFQDEADIALAEKEFDIQVLKAQSLYDHEKAINKVQSERIDAGVRVNKAMVQATVKRQVNFADQQIKFAEAEYAARMEHIEYTLNQELSYAEETLGYHEKNYAAKRDEIDQEYESKKHSLAQKKKLFEHSPMLKKVLLEEKDVDEAYQERLLAFEEQLANDISIKRYREQIQKAHDHAEKARNDALSLRDKDIEIFTALKEESLARLANVEKMMAGPELLPYHEESVNDQASERLKAMLKTAEDFLEEKTAEPKARLEDIKGRILELEKGDVDSTTVSELIRQEQNLNQSFGDRLDDLEKSLKEKRALLLSQTEQAQARSKTIIEAIDRELAEPIQVSSNHHAALVAAIEAKEKTLQITHEQWRSERLMKKNEQLNALNRTQSTIKNRLIDTSVKTQMKVEKIENLQNKAISESYKILHKQFKKDKKTL